MEFSSGMEDLVEKLNKSKLRLDQYDIKHLKDLFREVDKFGENDYLHPSREAIHPGTWFQLQPLK